MADSLTKTRAYIEALIDRELPAHLAALAAGMVTLPDSAGELDAKLEAFARDALTLRSDDAPALVVVHA